jgi:transposase
MSWFSYWSSDYGVTLYSIDRNCPIELPASLEGWLREDHLARFVVDVVEQLDLSAIEQVYSGRGSQAYPPKLMVALLFYGYATGVFSSRKLEQASYESVPFIYSAGGLHPDHDSINSFRKRFLAQLEELFVQILLIAHRLDVLKVGDIFIDGSKVEANASKHKAMSRDYANKLEARLKAEVEKLVELAGTAEVAASMFLSALGLARRCLYPTTGLSWPGRKARAV